MTADLNISIILLISAGFLGAAPEAQPVSRSTDKARQLANSGVSSSSSQFPVSASAGRPRSDLDDDCDVDLDDYAQMQRSFAGPAATGCCVDNTECAGDAYCRKPAGACDSFGECTPVGEGCYQQVDPVCGCDGRSYQNPCDAAIAGVNVRHRGACDVDICALAPEVGPCDGAFVRWFFNPTTNQCERFLYGGCGGNANNFEILEACEEQCRPDVDCTVNEDCASDDYCATPRGACEGLGRCQSRPQMCDATDEPVCGCDGRTYHNRVFAAVAGVSVAHVGPCEQNPCALSIDPGPCKAYIPRFAFNRVTGQCERFVYGGCLGNANNFETLEECVGACMPQIPCQENTDCPRGLFCLRREGVCEGDGVCEARPVACPEIYDPVCGCNGRTYANRCFAHAVGMVVARAGACEPDVCTLPVERGPCDGVFVRYAFNTDTGQCEPFIYGGCRGNGNNFATFEQCYAACVPERICQSSADCAEYEFCAKAIGACGGDGRCRARPVECPRCWEPVCGCSDWRTYANACEAYRAGVSVAFDGPCEENPCRLPVEVGPCDGAFLRFAFNPDMGQCERFVWGGCGGNANNFLTLEECQRACGEVSVCLLPRDRGPCDGAFERYGFDPTLGRCISFTYGGCKGNANNFETLEACGAACPPVDACEQPIYPGPCLMVIERYGFNVHSGQCELFIWGGCRANANNFETLEACRQRCPQVDLCELPIVVGPCEAAIPRYAFDQRTGRCELFTYGGCQGNANNFETLEACARRCPPVDRCTLPVEPGPCRGAFPRYAFDVDAGQCEEFIYGGCGGNANNFETLRACQVACDPDVCGLPPDVGPCDAVIFRFYYNVRTNACERFVWGGCDGNANNFATLEACQRACGR